MADLFMQLCCDGCVHFENLQISVYCDPERRSAITIRLKNLTDRPMEGDGGKELITEQCKSVNQFLRDCIRSWQDTMTKHRK